MFFRCGLFSLLVAQRDNVSSDSNHPDYEFSVLSLNLFWFSLFPTEQPASFKQCRKHKICWLFYWQLLSDSDLCGDQFTKSIVYLILFYSCFHSKGNPD